MQIKTTKRCHFTPLRKPLKQHKQKYWRVWIRGRAYYIGRNINVWHTMENPQEVEQATCSTVLSDEAHAYHV